MERSQPSNNRVFLGFRESVQSPVIREYETEEGGVVVPEGRPGVSRIVGASKVMRRGVDMAKSNLLCYSRGAVLKHNDVVEGPSLSFEGGAKDTAFLRLGNRVFSWIRKNFVTDRARVPTGLFEGDIAGKSEKLVNILVGLLVVLGLVSGSVVEKASSVGVGQNAHVATPAAHQMPSPPVKIHLPAKAPVQKTCGPRPLAGTCGGAIGFCPSYQCVDGSWVDVRPTRNPAGSPY